MNSITQVVNRICSIEQRFSKPSTTKFATLLQTQNQKINGTDASLSMANHGQTDIANMLQIAANKYGVDPQLVSAVAKAESDFNPEVVLQPELWE